MVTIPGFRIREGLLKFENEIVIKMKKTNLIRPYYDLQIYPMKQKSRETIPLTRAHFVNDQITQADLQSRKHGVEVRRIVNLLRSPVPSVLCKACLTVTKKKTFF
jgi:hypothetical protein